jgi:hypothetical protein
MLDRHHAGLRFDLAPGSPWRWTGDGGPADISLTDVLAAVNYARLAEVRGHERIAPAAIRAAHERAAQAALRSGDGELAARLVREQAEVAVLVSEEDAAGRLRITGHSLHNLRLSYRTICAPVLIAGTRRTKWFWTDGQFTAWQQARPGRGWRRGQSSASRNGRPAAPGAEAARAAGTTIL